MEAALVGAKEYVTFSKMHVLFGPSSIFLVPFGLKLANVHCGSWAKGYVTFCEMHVPFGPNNIFLVPFGLNLANVHCGSLGQRACDFLQNALILSPQKHFPRTLWFEFGKRALCQLGPKGT